LRHRGRLRKMIAFHLDRRLAARVDPSDVVQEALVDAADKLSDYLRHRPLPFYPWLRQLAWERLVKLHRRHLRAAKRDVRQEEPDVLDLPDESAVLLANRLLDTSSSPSKKILLEEMRERVRTALDRLPDKNRQVLVMYYLEQLPNKEIA